MGTGRCVVAVLIFSLISKSFARPIIRTTPENHRSAGADLISDGWTLTSEDFLYCDSWRLAIETNNAGIWSRIPARCEEYVKDYVSGDRYQSDSKVITEYALDFAKTVEVAGEGGDAWVFDVDETLLSNVPYYAAHGFGSETFDEGSFNEWAIEADAPALPASLKFYKELQQLGFTIFLLTGRDESQRNVTEQNLVYAGYSNWERLILRGTSDAGKLATTYKSEKRKELEDEGYTIHGSSGDQWSDLLGFAVAKRSFKLPNPMYYIA
ncbi:acid phosphatase 1-like [Diospyros lotus]|uniref:acid phosphatase 1-like n=1 Tax=Diospyros lotus TaxID=55363 RepID=UPI0022593FAD|nr:acid phosphatase 1-like [Diospyros lotus]